MNCLTNCQKTQQQPNAVVQRKQVREAHASTAGNQKKETLTVIPPTLIENQRLNTKNLYSHGWAKRERGRREWYQKEKGFGKIQIRSQKEVVDMGSLFAQLYFQLHSHFNGMVND